MQHGRRVMKGDVWRVVGEPALGLHDRDLLRCTGESGMGGMHVQFVATDQYWARAIEDWRFFKNFKLVSREGWSLCACGHTMRPRYRFCPHCGAPKKSQ
jgi:hypothetical protein